MFPPKIKIPNTRDTPWSERKRDRSPGINIEVDSIAGLIYSFLPQLSRRTSRCMCLSFTSSRLPPSTLHITTIHSEWASTSRRYLFFFLGIYLSYDVTIYLGRCSLFVWTDELHYCPFLRCGGSNFSSYQSGTHGAVYI
jgi:hypothetical protein